MKKIISAALSVCCFSSVFLSFASCGEKYDVTLNVASWDEYIDEGGSEGYDAAELGRKERKALYEEFEVWYRELTGKTIKVNYIPLQDNETMYTKITLGEKYDLLCPSEYMIIKLATEGYLKEFPDSFFDTTEETNYYSRGVSPYIQDIFDSNEINGVKWSKYAAGYMWGTTGFAYNEATVNAEDVKSWHVYDKNYKISAKDNIRDSYFEGLGMYYETELLALKDSLSQGAIELTSYQKQLSEKMNDTSTEVMSQVESLLKKMKSGNNFWGFETDNGKDDVIAGDIDVSYQWSGDAVYIMDEAEEKSQLSYAYCVPEAASNLWFDGWVMMNDAQEEAATMFINFLSRPDNVVRNMYYIGYTSCISGQNAYNGISVFDYISDTYSAEDEETDTAEYDLGYFFGEGHTLTVAKEQLHRQLFAQYPDEKTLERCVVMKYFDTDANMRANKLWQNVKGSN